VKQFAFPSSSSLQPSSTTDNNDDEKSSGEYCKKLNYQKKQKKRLKQPYKSKRSRKGTRGNYKARRISNSRSPNSQNVYELKSPGTATSNDYDDTSTYLFDSPTSSFYSTNENMSRSFINKSATNSNNSNGNNSREYKQYQSKKTVDLNDTKATKFASDSSSSSSVLNIEKMKKQLHLQDILSKQGDSLSRSQTSNSYELENLDNMFASLKNKVDEESMSYDDSLCVKLMQNYIDLVKTKRMNESDCEDECSPNNHETRTTTSSTTDTESPLPSGNDIASGIPKAQLSSLAKQHEQKEEKLKQKQQNQQGSQKKPVIFTLEENSSLNESQQTDRKDNNMIENKGSDLSATEIVRLNNA
jgi:hypothetical protein